MNITVTGAGGFIGGHLTATLLEQGHNVIAVDKKPFHAWYQVHANARNMRLDVSLLEEAIDAVPLNTDQVFNLAADMGGMGFIENHKAACMLSVLTSTHVLQAAKDAGAKYLYSSSACVYAADKQVDTDVTALAEADAYPAEAEDGYGWEKLFSERMCRHFHEDFGMSVRVPRFHNVYGPYGTWDGGREKAPAAIARKVLQARNNGIHTIDIWGDGEQTRSFMYVDDCVDGCLRLMESDFMDPINLGSAELVSINQLVSLCEEIIGVELQRTYDLTAPQGVRGRNSDNTLIKEVLDWEPSISLYDGMVKTIEWIDQEMQRVS